jgi:hypothetical protein
MIFIAMLMTFAVFFSGCSSEKEEPLDPIIAEACSVLPSILTCDIEMAVNYQYSFHQPSGSSEIDGYTFAQRTFLVDPIRIRSTITENINGQETFLGYYVIEQEDVARCYYLTENNEWYYYDGSPSDLLATATGNMAFVLNRAVHYTQLADEQVDGEDAYHFRAQLSGNNLAAFVRELGLTSSLSQEGWPGLKPESFNIPAAVTAQGDLDIDVWIIKSSNTPIKYTADLTSLAASLLDAALQANPETATLTSRVDNFFINVIYKDINSAANFDLPAEAENAIEMVPEGNR